MEDQPVKRWEWNEDFGEIQADFGGITIAYCDDKARGVLIAAAPDLLAALDALLNACYEADAHEDLSEYVDGSLLDAAAAASAKARGES